MTTAYFDESHGSGGNDQLLVWGGVVSDADKWVRFSAECERIKDYFKIPFVHAEELFNLKKKKIYGHLSRDERSQVLGTLLSAIRDHVEFAISSTIEPRQYRALTTQNWRQKHGTHYAMSVTGILLGLWEYFCQSTGAEHIVSIFFESSQHSGEAEEVVRGHKKMTDDIEFPVIDPKPMPNRLKIGGYGCLDKPMAPPLWAADLVAYCTYWEIMRADEFCAEIMASIEDKVPLYGVGMDSEKIRLIVDASAEAEMKRCEWKRDTHNLVKYLYREYGVLAKKHPRGVVLDASKSTPEQIKKLIDGK